MRIIGKALAASVAGLLALALMAGASLAASEFEGTWKVSDTAGEPYEITLAAEGKASGTHGAGQTGTWKAEGASAVITWDTGWTTIITKDGEGYKKTAFKKDAPLDGPPSNSSSAEKLK